MSSKVKKIQNNVETTKKVQLHKLYNTLCGSIIVTIGKCVEMDENEMIKWFAEFSKDEELAKCKNVLEVCDYIIEKFHMPEEYKDNIVFVYDNNNVYTPVVSLCIDNMVLPLDRDGKTLGIISHIGEENIEVEWIYED